MKPFALCALFLVSCATNRFVADHSISVIDDQTKAFFRESSLKFAGQAAPSMLKMLDGLIMSSPENKALLTRGANLYCGYAMVLVEDEDQELATLLYRKGYHYALRALKVLVKDFNKLLKGDPDKMQEALERLDKKEAPAVFWAGACLAGYINLNLDDADALADIPRMLAFARAALALDERYFYAAPHFLLGTYFGSIGEALGGNPGASKEHFHRHFALTEGKFLLGKVYYAKSYLVQTQGKEEFRKVLQEVLEAQIDEDPDAALANQAAKRKAKALLERIDEIFP